MFDTRVRAVIDPVLDRVGHGLASAGISANGVTWIGFVLGVFAAVSIAAGYFGWGLALLLSSRICDGLDGSVARAGIGREDRCGNCGIGRPTGDDTLAQLQAFDDD